MKKTPHRATEAHVSWLLVWQLQFSGLNCTGKNKNHTLVVLVHVRGERIQILQISHRNFRCAGKGLIYSQCASQFPGRIWCTGCLTGSVFGWQMMCPFTRHGCEAAPPVPVSGGVGVSDATAAVSFRSQWPSVWSLSPQIRLHSTSVRRVVDKDAISWQTRYRNNNGNVSNAAFKIKDFTLCDMRGCFTLELSTGKCVLYVRFFDRTG